MKTKIVLPFKDDLPVRRFKSCLDVFLPKFKQYLDAGPNFDYEIFIVEEHTPDTTTFNLGRTINIGFDLIKDSMEEHDIFMFHPIDILPVDTDYSVSKNTKFCMLGYRPLVFKPQPKQKILDGHYYYKAICLTKMDYQKVNGFTNEFVGWGGEDDEFFVRLNMNNVNMDIAVNEYSRLTHDGSNGPNHFRHLDIVNKSISEGQCLSGLDTLTYEFLGVHENNGVNNYIVR